MGRYERVEQCVGERQRQEDHGGTVVQQRVSILSNMCEYFAAARKPVLQPGHYGVPLLIISLIRFLGHINKTIFGLVNSNFSLHNKCSCLTTPHLIFIVTMKWLVKK